MRIINITPSPRHISYATVKSGGILLQPGQSSVSLPTDRIHMPLVLKDYDSNVIDIIFEADDIKFFERLLAIHKGNRRKVQSLPPPPPKPSKAKKAAQKGTPDFTPRPESESIKLVPIEGIFKSPLDQGNVKSLSSLMNANKNIKR